MSRPRRSSKRSSCSASGDVRRRHRERADRRRRDIAVIDEAEAQSIPVLEFTETLPDGQTYLSWMQANIAALADALAR